MLYIIEDHELTGIEDCNEKHITIPNSVKRIAAEAFVFCENITEITIPDSVTEIGDCAFWACSNLTNVTIPDNVKRIGDRAFAYCESLKSITIPKNASIGDEAFPKDCKVIFE